MTGPTITLGLATPLGAVIISYYQSGVESLYKYHQWHLTCYMASTPSFDEYTHL